MREKEYLKVAYRPIQILMKFISPDMLFTGLKAGIELHWYLQKNLAVVKPEYLLTVAVAKEIASAGFQTEDVEIVLEAPTVAVAGRCVVRHLGSGRQGLSEWIRLRKLTQQSKKGKTQAERDLAAALLALAPTTNVSRNGKVDIFVAVSRAGPNPYGIADGYVVELKGFDPSDAQVELDVVRLKEFLSLNNRINDCEAVFLVYPAIKSQTEAALQKMATSVLGTSGTLGFSWKIHQRIECTAQPEEEGMAAYRALCLEITKQPVQPRS